LRWTEIDDNILANGWESLLEKMYNFELTISNMLRVIELNYIFKNNSINVHEYINIDKIKRVFIENKEKIDFNQVNEKHTESPEINEVLDFVKTLQIDYEYEQLKKSIVENIDFPMVSGEYHSCLTKYLGSKFGEYLSDVWNNSNNIKKQRIRFFINDCYKHFNNSPFVESDKLIDMLSAFKNKIIKPESNSISDFHYREIFNDCQNYTREIIEDRETIK